MNTIEIKKKGIFSYPDSWAEVTEEQFDFIMRQFLKLMDDKISMDEFKLLVLFDFLNFKTSPFDRFKERYMRPRDHTIRNENLYRLTDTLNWFFTQKQIKDQEKWVFNFTSVKNYIPKLDVFPQFLYGPDSALLNVSFGEFRTAVEYFRRYSEFKQEHLLDHLIACLYRPQRDNYYEHSLSENFDGQRRKAFNLNHIAEYAKKIEEIPFYQKYAIYLWFGNCNNFFREGSFQVEGQDICLGDLYTTEDKKKVSNQKNESLGWTGLLFRLADEGTFGKLKETDQTNIYDIMLKLHQWKTEAEASKKTEDDTN